MDVSKLPRLSNTQTPPPSEGGAPGPTPAAPPAADQSTAAPPPFDYGHPAPAPFAGLGVEAWFSIGIGLIFFFAFPHFTQWLIHTVFHTKNEPSFLPITDSNTGQEIPYPKSDFFLNDLSIAAFAYALIIEGLVLILARKPATILLALTVTAAAVLLNAYFMISSFGDGFPIVSAIAVLFGGYMLWYQWRLMQEMIAIRATDRLQPPPTAAAQ